MNDVMRHVVGIAVGSAICCMSFGVSVSTAADPPLGPHQPDSTKLPPGVLFRLGSPQLRAEENLAGLRFSHDGEFLIGTERGEDRSESRFCAWKLDTGEPTTLSDKLAGEASRGKPNDPEAHKKWRFSRGKDNSISVLDSATGAEALHVAARESVSFELSPDESLLAVNSSDAVWTNSVVEVWDIATKTKRHEWKIGDRFITRAIFSKGNGLLIGGGLGLFCWDLTNGKQLAPLSDKRYYGVFLISPDGTKLAAEVDKGIDILELPSCRTLFSIPLDGYPCGMTYSDDGRLLATGCGARAIVFDLKTGKTLARVPDLSGPIQDIVFSRDGKRLAALDSVNNAGDGHDIAWWNLADRLPQHRAHFPDPTVTLTTSVNGLFAVADRRTSEPLVWDVKGEKFVPNLVLGPSTVVVAASRTGARVDASPDGSLNNGQWRGHVGEVLALAVSADGSKIASVGSDRTLRIWRHGSANAAAEIALPGQPRMCIAFAEDGMRVAVATDQRLSIWKSSGGDPIAAIDFHDEQPAIARFARSGKTIAVGTTSGRIAVYEAETGKILRQVEGHSKAVSALEFAEDDSALYSGGMDGAVFVWNPASLEKIAKLDERPSPVDYLLWIPDGKRLAACDEGPAIVVYDASSRKRLADVHTFVKGKLLYLRKDRRPAAISRSGAEPNAGEESLLLCRLNRLGNEEVCDLRTYKLRWGDYSSTVDERDNFSAAFSADGKLVAKATPAATRVWDSASGKPWHDFITSTSLSRAVAFSHSGKLLAAGGDGMCVWRTEDHAKVFEVKAGIDSIDNLFFSPDDRVLATIEMSNKIKLWDSLSGNLARELSIPHGFYVRRAMFINGGRSLMLAPYPRNPVFDNPFAGKAILFEVATGDRLDDLTAPMQTFTSFAVSADERQLAFGQANGTILICDGKRWFDQLFSRPATGDSPSLEQLWTDLGDSNPKVAYAAIGWMAGEPDKSVPLLRRKLPTLRIESLTKTEIDALIRQLASDDSERVRQASAKLLRGKPATNSEIQAALTKSPPPEVRARLELLLAAPSPPSDARLRVIRAVQTLERIDSVVANELLKSLAANPEKSEMAREAQSAIVRLDAKNVPVDSAGH